MCCDLPVQAGVKSPGDCKCYNAVMRAFRALSDQPPHVAMEVAQRVYQYHHPEDAVDIAFLTVERWVNEERMQ